MQAQQPRLVAAHLRLVSLWNRAHGLEMHPQQMQVKGRRDGNRHIENATLKRQCLRTDLIGERGLRVARLDGQAREEGETACRIASMRQFGVGQVHARCLQALLQLCHVIGGADLTNAEDVGVNCGKHFHHLGALGLGLWGGRFADGSLHRQPVLQIVGAERQALRLGGGQECRESKKNGGSQDPPREL
ncbi:MAG: hypothetical protein B7Z21_00845 [Verrucomicrobiales bacterium 32-60-5]|nr:MAG: hypothetical protein B7Z21_00845 [Verrucomicrobiales bacterium 32-60-5]